MFKELFIESDSEEQYYKEISAKTGLNSKFLAKWCNQHDIDAYDLMQGIGQKKIKALDLVVAVSGDNKQKTKQIQKFLSENIQEALKGKLKLRDNNMFLTYPKEIVQDINDAWDNAIDDYDINGNNVVISYTKKVDTDTAKAINNYIRNIKGYDV